MLINKHTPNYLSLVGFNQFLKNNILKICIISPHSKPPSSPRFFSRWTYSNYIFETSTQLSPCLPTKKNGKSPTSFVTRLFSWHFWSPHLGGGCIRTQILRSLDRAQGEKGLEMFLRIRSPWNEQQQEYQVWNTFLQKLVPMHNTVSSKVVSRETTASFHVMCGRRWEGASWQKNKVKIGTVIEK